MDYTDLIKKAHNNLNSIVISVMEEVSRQQIQPYCFMNQAELGPAIKSGLEAHLNYLENYNLEDWRDYITQVTKIVITTTSTPLEAYIRVGEISTNCLVTFFTSSLATPLHSQAVDSRTLKNIQTRMNSLKMVAKITATAVGMQERRQKQSNQ